MPDPVMLAIAGAVAGKTAEAAFKGGRRALDGLITLVKNRFSREPSAQAALEAAQDAPDEHVERLAGALSLVAASDPQFAQLLHSEWQRIQPDINAGPGAVVNSISGRVDGNVTQIGTIGKASFGHYPD